MAFRSAELMSYGYHTQIILTAIGGPGIALALPMLSSLPYTTTMVDDIRSGYIRLYLPRIGVAPYISSKIITCALAGGMAVLLGVIIANTSLSLLLLPLESKPMIIEGAEKIVKHLPPIYGKYALLFASGCFWSTLGLLLASITNSRYIAFSGPFIVCYILIILYERYFKFLYVFYPREWLNPSDQWFLGSWGVAILLLVFSVVLGCIFAYWAQRKLVKE